MRLELLREFLVYAQYMNLTKASYALHVSQPNLSKHLKQLEAEVGFALLDRERPHTRLTPAGENFLVSISAVMESYDEAVARGLEISNKPSITLNVMQHYYTDEGSQEYYARLADYQRTHPSVTIRYSNPYREGSVSRLRSGDIDLALTYAAGALRIPGFETRRLAEVKLSLWCRHDSPLAARQHCALRDLEDYHILKPNDANIPFYFALDNLCKEHDCSLTYRMVSSSTQTEYYLMSLGESDAIIIPSGMHHDQRVAIQTDRVFVPIDQSLVAYVVFRKEPVQGIDLGDIFTETSGD